MWHSTRLTRFIAFFRRARPRAMLAYKPRFLLAQLLVTIAGVPPLRYLAWWLGGGALHEIQAALDPEFYLAQLPAPGLRRGAATMPALHYLLVGKFLNLSPRPGFDPHAYRGRNPQIPKGCAPFLHYLRYAQAPDRTGDTSCRAAPRTALLLDHARGGGSRCLELHAQRLHLQGWNIRLARCTAGGRPLLVLDAADGGAPRWFDPGSAATDLQEHLRRLGVRHIVVNHLIDLPPAAFEWLPRLAAALGAGYEVLLHDYYYVCPRVNLIDARGRYCAIAPTADCRACLAQAGSSTGVIDAADWRVRAHRFLAGAERVVAPSRDLAARLGPHLPQVSIEVLEPESDGLWPATRMPRLGAQEPLRLALIGALNVAKGYDIVAALARLAADRAAPLRFDLFGHSPDDARLRRCGVAVHGRYREADIDGLIGGSGAHAAFLPAIWPETWSFVQSIAFRHGLPVVAFDHGAIALRLRRRGQTTALPLNLSRDPPGLLRALLTLRQRYLVHAGGAC